MAEWQKRILAISAEREHAESLYLRAADMVVYASE